MDENEPYNSIDSVLHALVWPVVLVIAAIGMVALITLIGIFI